MQAWQCAQRTSRRRGTGLSLQRCEECSPRRRFCGSPSQVSAKTKARRYALSLKLRRGYALKVKLKLKVDGGFVGVRRRYALKLKLAGMREPEEKLCIFEGLCIGPSDSRPSNIQSVSLGSLAYLAERLKALLPLPGMREPKEGRGLPGAEGAEGPSASARDARA